MWANRLGIILTLTLTATLWTGVAYADPSADYPNRVIKLVVPYPPGGGGDVVGRLIGREIENALGKPVIVENKPGAAGNIGAEFVARSAPDGYTILLATNGILAANPHLYKSVSFNTMKDFTFISQVADAPIALVLHPSTPAKSLKEFIALAKSKPGEVTYGSGGVGTIGQLTAELFMIESGVKLRHIPYKGTPPAHIDLLAGRIATMFDQIATSLQNMRAGKLRALVVTRAERHPLLPDVPSIAEVGLKGAESTTWYGLVAPGGTPKAIIAKLSKAVNQALAKPETRAAFVPLALDPVGSDPEVTRAFIGSELVKWKTIVQKAGIKPN